MMDKQRWTKVGLEIAEHLAAIKRITEQSGMEILCISATADGFVEATYIEDGTHYSATIDQYGSLRLSVDYRNYYTKA